MLTQCLYGFYGNSNGLTDTKELLVSACDGKHGLQGLTKARMMNRSCNPNRRVLSLIERRMVNLAVRTHIATTVNSQDTTFTMVPRSPMGAVRLLSNMSIP